MMSSRSQSSLPEWKYHLSLDLREDITQWACKIFDTPGLSLRGTAIVVRMEKKFGIQK
jgi:hypothetical protein